jgi:hypothetical protein
MNDLVRRARQWANCQAVKDLADKVGRSPTQVECNAIGVFFGTGAPYARLRDLLVDAGLEVRPPGLRTDRKPRGIPEPTPPVPPSRLRRRCHACDQLTSRTERCTCCGALWARGRTAEDMDFEVTLLIGQELQHA